MPKLHQFEAQQVEGETEDRASPYRIPITALGSTELQRRLPAAGLRGPSLTALNALDQATVVRGAHASRQPENRLLNGQPRAIRVIRGVPLPSHGLRHLQGRNGLVTMWQHPLAAVAASTDLEAALTTIERNDLLPPRHEDNVGGESGKRLSEALSRAITSGLYEPDRALIIPVPKTGLTTRPAALVTLNDRVVYEALVAALRPRIEKYLVPSGTLFWPRGQKSPKRWREFDESPTKVGGTTHVCLLDIAGFYETVSHDRLATTLIEGTGRRPLVEALSDFLSRLMDSDRGCPKV